MSKTATAKKEAKPKSPGIHFIQKVIKGDTYLVLADPAYQIEDEFAGNYFTLAASTKIILQPPFDPKALSRLTTQNNVLSQCIDVMEVNIDGTGYDFVPIESEKVKEPPDPPKKPVHPPPPMPTVMDGKPNPAKPSLITQDGKVIPPAPPANVDTTAVVANSDARAAHAHTVATQAADDKFADQMKDYDAEVKRQAEDAAVKAEVDRLKGFFDEPYPNVSFVTMRRVMRRELESIGFAFFEMLRNPQDELVGMRNHIGHATRMVKLDTPIQVEKTVEREGKEVTLKVWGRERRFAQRLWGINTDAFVYYREYGSTRQINRHTGEWESKDNPVKPEDRGSELLMFSVIPDTDSPYSVPRWINQLPSVVGSRKAEESNLEYFDAGGLPPAIIFVQGGVLAEDVSEQLKQYMSGMAKNRNRAVVVEAQSSSGSLESAGQVKVLVERFGAEKANDSMFQNYSATAAENIRRAFRFNELFLGDAGQANFATALTAFMVGEAQVFAPERAEFDEIMNKTVLKELGVKLVKMKSNPITLKNVEVQLQAIGLVEALVDKKALVDEVNKVAGTSLEFDQKAADAAAASAAAPGQMVGAAPQEGAPEDVAAGAKQIGASLPSPKVKAPVGMNTGRLASGLLKSESEPGVSAREMFGLVDSYMHMHGLIKRARAIAPSERRRVKMAIESFSKPDEMAFYELLATITLGTPEAAELVHDHE